VTDVKHAFRILRQSPGFTATAVAVLALGIGANTAIFTLLDQLILRLLPVHNPEQLVMRLIGRTFASRTRYERAQRLAQLGQWPFKRGEVIERLPGELRGWTIQRDLPVVPEQSFRDWWRQRSQTATQAPNTKQEEQA